MRHKGFSGDSLEVAGSGSCRRGHRRAPARLTLGLPSPPAFIQAGPRGRWAGFCETLREDPRPPPTCPRRQAALRLGAPAFEQPSCPQTPLRFWSQRPLRGAAPFPRPRPPRPQPQRRLPLPRLERPPRSERLPRPVAARPHLKISRCAISRRSACAVSSARPPRPKAPRGRGRRCSRLGPGTRGQDG